MDKLIQEIIKLMLKYKVINTNFKSPITFKSGIKSPIYCDFRKCAQYPDLMELIATAFFTRYEKTGPFDVVMGVATGAISHATLLASKLGLPGGYIRPGAKVKDYGTGKLIEGADVSGKTVVLIEDVVSSGGSLIENIKILEKAGAESVVSCSIFSYKMEKAEKQFSEANTSADTLITVHMILPYLKKTLTEKEYKMLEDWVADPEGWFDIYKTEFDFGFLTTLRKTTAHTGSIISMGLDPVIESLPQEFAQKGIDGAVAFYYELISEMIARKVMPGMYKPNEGFYTKYNKNIGDRIIGTSSLNDIAYHLHDMVNIPFTEIPTCIDAKRGDIGKSSQNYGEQYLGGDFQPYQAITVSPYMGTDSVEPFIKFCNPVDAKGVYILNKTSNPGSYDIQMARMMDGRYVYQLVSDKIVEWAKGKPGVGAVVGATDPTELRTILAFYAGKDIPVLVPGVGAQGGSAKDVAQIAREVGFELALLRINSSSGLTHPWYKKPGDKIPLLNECIDLSIAELQKLNEEVGQI